MSINEINETMTALGPRCSLNKWMTLPRLSVAQRPAARTVVASIIDDASSLVLSDVPTIKAEYFELKARVVRRVVGAGIRPDNVSRFCGLVEARVAKLDPHVGDALATSSRIYHFAATQLRDMERRLNLRLGVETTAARATSHHIDPLTSTTRPSRKRRNLPAAARDAMRAWLVTHAANPFPTAAEKAELAQAGGISVEQVTTWFINARGRARARPDAPGGPGQEVASFFK